MEHVPWLAHGSQIDASSRHAKGIHWHKRSSDAASKANFQVLLFFFGIVKRLAGSEVLFVPFGVEGVGVLFGFFGGVFLGFLNPKP